MTLRIATANRLRDGVVVYLTQDGDWSQGIETAAIARDDDEAARLDAQGVRAVADLRVVGPYLLAVVEDDGRARPLGMREAIRAAGPTVIATTGSANDVRL